MFVPVLALGVLVRVDGVVEALNRIDIRNVLKVGNNEDDEDDDDEDESTDQRSLLFSNNSEFQTQVCDRCVDFCQELVTFEHYQRQVLRRVGWIVPLLLIMLTLMFLLESIEFFGNLKQLPSKPTTTVCIVVL